MKYRDTDRLYYAIFYISVHFSWVAPLFWNVNPLSEAIQIIPSPSVLHIPLKHYLFHTEESMGYG